MGSVSFFGHAFLGIGPAVAFFVVFIAFKPLIVLVSLASAFCWLLVLFGISALFRGFLPLAPATGSYAGAVLAAVVLQEAARYGTWLAHKRFSRVLEGYASSTRLRFNQLDHIYLAMAWGYGHGAVHSALQFASLLPLTVGDGTYYYPQCPKYSVFLAGALNSLSFWSTLTAASVIYFDALDCKRPVQAAAASGLHVAAALLTLISLAHNGCNVSIPLLLALGTGSMVAAASLTWRRAQELMRRLQ